MEITNTYLDFKPSYKYIYMKNNNINPEEITTEDLFFRIYRDIDIVLNSLKISPSKVGYGYWRDAILLSIMSEKNHLRVCNDVYPVIAKKYNKTSISIERAMRICFGDVMDKITHGCNEIVDYMEDAIFKPHNSEILIKIVELIMWLKNCIFHIINNLITTMCNFIHYITKAYSHCSLN